MKKLGSGYTAWMYELDRSSTVDIEIGDLGPETRTSPGGVTVVVPPVMTSC
jgi:hypothetical protein